MKEFWNQRYSEKEMAYGTAPNQFFKDQLADLKPGKLLLPAEGEGRNAVYAAQKGWRVLAFDYSIAGKTKALKLADEAGVTIDYQLAEAADYSCEPESVDAVALIFAHFPPALRTELHQKVQQWLKPGGTLILEAFHPKQLEGYSSGGPKTANMLYTAEMLKEDFRGLTIELLEEGETDLHEGVYHQGKGYVTRLVAIKN